MLGQSVVHLWNKHVSDKVKAANIHFTTHTWSRNPIPVATSMFWSRWESKLTWTVISVSLVLRSMLAALAACSELLDMLQEGACQFGAVRVS